MKIAFFSRSLPDGKRVPDRGLDHFFRTASPALIKAWIRDKDRQVVAATIAPDECTRSILEFVGKTRIVGRDHVARCPAGVPDLMATVNISPLTVGR